MEEKNNNEINNNNNNNNNHKRYGFFGRVFGWKKTYEQIVNDMHNEVSADMNRKIEQLNYDLEIKEKELEEKIEWFTNQTKSLEASLRHKDEQLRSALVSAGETLAFKNTNETLKRSIEETSTLIETYKSQVGELRGENHSLREENKTLTERYNRMESEKKEIASENESSKQTIGALKESLNNLQNRISDDQRKVMEDTNELLGIFKKTTGVAGKIAELRLEDLITKTSIDTDSWTTNLSVGQDTVEFAIKAEDDGNKWIPVDSKLIGAFTEGEIIVDDAYVKSVAKQSKTVSKYLNKKNTTPFGIMVLQSDFIYNEIYENNPEVLTNSIIENSIFIMSPSAFVQFSTAINKLTKTFEKAKKASEISGELNIVIDHINKMLKAWEQGFDFMRKIEETHMKNIRGSVNKVDLLNRIEYTKTEDN